MNNNDQKIPPQPDRKEHILHMTRHEKKLDGKKSKQKTMTDNQGKGKQEYPTEPKLELKNKNRGAIITETQETTKSPAQDKAEVE